MMKKVLFLLTVAVVTVNSVGCSCRGLRDWCYRGARCAQPATAAPAQLYTLTPVATPGFRPMSLFSRPTVPVFQHCAPQPCAPQFATAAPVAYTDASCCPPTVTEMGCGVPYAPEAGCGYQEGVVMPSPAMYPGPGTE